MLLYCYHVAGAVGVMMAVVMGDMTMRFFNCMPPMAIGEDSSGKLATPLLRREPRRIARHQRGAFCAEHDNALLVDQLRAVHDHAPVGLAG